MNAFFRQPRPSFLTYSCPSSFLALIRAWINPKLISNVKSASVWRWVHYIGDNPAFQKLSIALNPSLLNNSCAKGFFFVWELQDSCHYLEVWAKFPHYNYIFSHPGHVFDQISKRAKWMIWKLLILHKIIMYDSNTSTDVLGNFFLWRVVKDCSGAWCIQLCIFYTFCCFVVMCIQVLLNLQNSRKQTGSLIRKSVSHDLICRSAHTPWKQHLLCCLAQINAKEKPLTCLVYIQYWNYVKVSWTTNCTFLSHNFGV